MPTPATPIFHGALGPRIKIRMDLVSRRARPGRRYLRLDGGVAYGPARAGFAGAAADGSFEITAPGLRTVSSLFDGAANATRLNETSARVALREGSAVALRASGGGAVAPFSVKDARETLADAGAAEYLAAERKLCPFVLGFAMYFKRTAPAFQRCRNEQTRCSCG